MKAKWAVVEFDVFNTDYARVMEDDHNSKESAQVRVRYFTQTYGGGGKYYEVRTVRHVKRTLNR